MLLGRRTLLLACFVLFIILSGSSLHPKTWVYVDSARRYAFPVSSPHSPLPPPPPPSAFSVPTSDREQIIRMGPPTYSALREFERKLPQHNLDNKFPEGKKGRYVKFSNQYRQIGWNNCFNEILLNAHLAYMSNRAYVFHDFYWHPDHYPWPKDQYLESIPRTPLGAIISGPTAGGPWEAGDDAPRSISEEWHRVVCPKSERRLIQVEPIKADLMESEGSVILETWTKILRDAPESCIEIVTKWDANIDFFPQVFDLRLFGSMRIFSLFEIFLKSPTSRLLDASPVVKSAVDRNQYLFLPQGPRPPKGISNDVWDRVLAMHLRRGDYENHCKGIAFANYTWYSWNLHPSLPDKLHQLPDQTENEKLIMTQCWPSAQLVAKKARDARADFIAQGKAKGEERMLDIIYILSNDHTSFMDELVSTLRDDGWNTIRSTRELQLDQEQTDVSFAVDMDLARRAAVFIGNGWSSYTSNIVYTRTKYGKDLATTRFF